MPDYHSHLLTPTQAEKLLGEKYFYRQRIYRMVESGKLTPFALGGQTCFIGGEILDLALKELSAKLKEKYPTFKFEKLRIFYDSWNEKRIVIDGISGKSVHVDTATETEDDLIAKFSEVVGLQEAEKVQNDTSIEDYPELLLHSGQTTGHTESDTIGMTLPEDIFWVRIDTGIIADVEVKSFILISMPSIAQFIGIRPDKFAEWLSKTTFLDSVLSAHYKQIQGTEIPVPWKRRMVSGLIPFIPFELLPEVIVAFKQSGRTVTFPEKANLLYDLAKSTLEAVGLSLAGSRDEAASELAKIGKGMGLSVAEQIIGVFRQYESRDYQIETNKAFNRKVKALKQDYATISGVLTLGITGKSAAKWKLFGVSRNLPSKDLTSGRQVMRALSPSDGVGMTFGERHYIKEPNTEEAIATGRQGKEFYDRLKKVGLLE